MKFIDSTEIKVRAGNGGSGAVSFRTARNRPKLGADGGNGGNGGNVIIVADKNVNTLNTLRYRQLYKAEHGGNGGENERTGACGKDIKIPVPLGTIVFNAETGEELGEIIDTSTTLTVAKGGKRGYGNNHFLKATHQAPRESSPGEEGEELEIRFELKVLADVGLAGFPNAGKSTLLSRISAAKPKIADYPFTTLVPNLGVVDLSEFGKFQDSFVIADIPGLIEGASDGKGLGHAFLRHLERTRIILYVIDGFCIEGRDPLTSYEKLHLELEKFGTTLTKRKSLVLVNKIDLAPEDFDFEALEAEFEDKGQKVMFISGVSGEGISKVKIKLMEMLAEEKEVKDRALEAEDIEFLSNWSYDKSSTSQNSTYQ